MLAFTWRQEGKDFSVTFEPCAREPLSWKEELYTAARSVASEAKKPLWLCLSGGINSEVMCNAFFDQGIHFSVLTLRHAAGTNDHEIEYAKKWCARHGVHQNIVDIDFERFLREDIETYVQQGYVSGLIFRYLQIRLLEIVEKLGGFAVLAAGEQNYRVKQGLKEPETSDVFLRFESNITLPLDWMRRNDTEHMPYFLHSTPELSLSYMRSPIVDTMLHMPTVFRHPNNVYLIKRLAFQTTWFELEQRPKYHGFESMEHEVAELRRSIRDRFGTELRTYDLPLVELKRQLEAKLT